MAKKLRHGYTTGACAAAAALGAARLLRDQQGHAEVDLDLPAGFSARFQLHGQSWTPDRASCFVVKDAGDDPDVTHGVEVHAELLLVPGGCGFEILAGKGIGRVTKPGLAVPVGEPAINPVPRRMILAALRSVFPEPPAGRGLQLTLSIPDGEERARRTLNERLGILGGLSLLGTSGVVRPISHQAWTDTLLVALDVALAAGVPAVVCSTGRSSERAAQEAVELPEEAFIMMGDHIVFTAEACHRKGVPQLLLAAQFAKLVKIACGHGQTHAGRSSLDLLEVAAMAREAGLDGSLGKTLELANTAREVWLQLTPAHPLVGLVAERALQQLRSWAPGVRVGLLLADYEGRVAARFGETELTRRL